MIVSGSVSGPAAPFGFLQKSARSEGELSRRVLYTRCILQAVHGRETLIQGSMSRTFNPNPYNSAPDTVLDVAVPFPELRESQGLMANPAPKKNNRPKKELHRSPWEGVWDSGASLMSRSKHTHQLPQT